jgi:hypothetical protein
MRNIRLLFLFVCLLATVPVYAESYLCVGDMTTGFSFDKNQRVWKRATFRSPKFILARTNGEKSAWGVKEMGDTIPTSYCEGFENEVLMCGGFFEFRMNRETLRFMSIYMFGYWTDDKSKSAGKEEGDDTPALTIGKCSPF